MRLIPPEELAPLSPNIPADDKHLEVSIGKQRVKAFEGDKLVFQSTVSTGVESDKPSPNGIPTETPLGRFYIGNKMPSRHMGDGSLDNSIYAYELPGVPWNMFFVSTGVAFHGAYWHDNFGYPMSAGCVNLRPKDAKWLYRWTTPALEPGEWHRYEQGTRIDVVA
jgi:lipoprotein-anchoring transpeptidase ErfK/SrfK